MSCALNLVKKTGPGVGCVNFNGVSAVHCEDECILKASTVGTVALFCGFGGRIVHKGPMVFAAKLVAAPVAFKAGLTAFIVLLGCGLIYSAYTVGEKGKREKEQMSKREDQVVQIQRTAKETETRAKLREQKAEENEKRAAEKVEKAIQEKDETKKLLLENQEVIRTMLKQFGEEQAARTADDAQLLSSFRDLFERLAQGHAQVMERLESSADKLEKFIAFGETIVPALTENSKFALTDGAEKESTVNEEETKKINERLDEILFFLRDLKKAIDLINTNEQTNQLYKLNQQAAEARNQAAQAHREVTEANGLVAKLHEAESLAYQRILKITSTIEKLKETKLNQLEANEIELILTDLNWIKTTATPTTSLETSV